MEASYAPGSQRSVLESAARVHKSVESVEGVKNSVNSIVRFEWCLYKHTTNLVFKAIYAALYLDDSSRGYAQEAANKGLRKAIPSSSGAEVVIQCRVPTPALR